MKIDLNPLESELVRSVMRNQALLAEKRQVALQAAEEAAKRAAGYQREVDGLRVSTLAALSLARGLAIPAAATVVMSEDGKTCAIAWEDPPAKPAVVAPKAEHVAERVGAANGEAT